MICWKLLFLLVLLYICIIDCKDQILSDSVSYKLQRDEITYASVSIPRYARKVIITLSLQRTAKFKPFALLRYDGLPTLSNTPPNAIYQLSPDEGHEITITDENPSYGTLFIGFWGGTDVNSLHYFTGGPDSASITVNTQIYSCVNPLERLEACQDIDILPISKLGNKIMYDMSLSEDKQFAYFIPALTEAVGLDVLLKEESLLNICEKFVDTYPDYIFDFVVSSYLEQDSSDKNSIKTIKAFGFKDLCEKHNGGDGTNKLDISLTLKFPTTGFWVLKIAFRLLDRSGRRYLLGNNLEISSEGSNNNDLNYNTPTNRAHVKVFQRRIQEEETDQQQQDEVENQEGQIEESDPEPTDRPTLAPIPNSPTFEPTESVLKDLIASLEISSHIIACPSDKYDPEFSSLLSHKTFHPDRCTMDIIGLNSTHGSTASVGSHELFAASEGYLHWNRDDLSRIPQVQMSGSFYALPSFPHGHALQVVLHIHPTNISDFISKHYPFLGDINVLSHDDYVQYVKKSVHFRVSLRFDGTAFYDRLLAFTGGVGGIQDIDNDPNALSVTQHDFITRNGLTLTTRDAQLLSLDKMFEDTSSQNIEVNAKEEAYATDIFDMLSFDSLQSKMSANSLLPVDRNEIKAMETGGYVTYLWTIHHPELAGINGGNAEGSLGNAISINIAPLITQTSSLDEVALDDMIVSVRVSFLDCPANYCIHGTCHRKEEGDVGHFYCACLYSWAGEQCEYRVIDVNSYILEVTTLVSSTAAVIPAVTYCLHYNCELFSALLSTSALSSAFFHLCNTEAYCLAGLSYLSIQVMDVLFSTLSIVAMIVYYSPITSNQQLAAVIIIIAAIILAPTISDPTEPVNVIFAIALALLANIYMWLKYFARLRYLNQDRSFYKPLTHPNSSNTSSPSKYSNVIPIIPNHVFPDIEEAFKDDFKQMPVQVEQNAGTVRKRNATIPEESPNPFQPLSVEDNQQEHDSQSITNIGDRSHYVSFAKTIETAYEQASIFSNIKWSAKAFYYFLGPFVIGIMLVFLGLLNFLTQLPSNYWYMHSVWQLCISFATYPLIYARIQFIKLFYNK